MTSLPSPSPVQQKSTVSPSPWKRSPASPQGTRPSSLLSWRSEPDPTGNGGGLCCPLTQEHIITSCPAGWTGVFGPQEAALGDRELLLAGAAWEMVGHPALQLQDRGPCACVPADVCVCITHARAFSVTSAACLQSVHRSSLRPQVPSGAEGGLGACPRPPVSSWGRAQGSTPDLPCMSAACRPCSDAEFLLAVCTSDFGECPTVGWVVGRSWGPVFP